jgi:predicted O-linked N-acetylglucosamine transferase (SPINDLY family)
MIRPEEEAFFSERVLRLPVSYLTFTVNYPVPPVVSPPCLQNDYFTFGSLVTQYKITPQVMDAWAALLRGAASARLVLANLTLKSPHNRHYVREQFRLRDVDPDRLTLHGPADHATYLRHYDKIDLALDSFPYNGGTTTMEAIWQGVPVLTFDGDRWISRTSQTLLRRCHLGQFVATDVEDLVQRGISWACEPTAWPKLAELRAEMRQRLAASSACDTPALARGMEQIYDEIWARWDQGQNEQRIQD